MIQCIIYLNMSGKRNVQPAAHGKSNDLVDGFAIFASTACMIHCLALPLLLAALPAIASRLNVGESFHAIVLLLAVPTSAWALIGGWRRHHARLPLLTGLAGLILMAGGIFFASREAVETGLTVAGSLCLAGAHIANWRQRSMARRYLSPPIPVSSRI
jgi:hypothetical protein